MLRKICSRYAVSYTISTGQMPPDSRKGRKMKDKVHTHVNDLMKDGRVKKTNKKKTRLFLFIQRLCS